MPVLKMFYAHSGFNPETNDWNNFSTFVNEHRQTIRSAVNEVGIVIQRTVSDVEHEPAEGYFESDNNILPLITVGGVVRIGMHRGFAGDRVAVVTYPHNVGSELHAGLDDLPNDQFYGRYGIEKEKVSDAVAAVEGVLLSYLENSHGMVSGGKVFRRYGDHFTLPVKRDQVHDVEEHLRQFHNALHLPAPVSRQRRSDRHVPRAHAAA